MSGLLHSVVKGWDDSNLTGSSVCGCKNSNEVACKQIRENGSVSAP